MKLQEVANGPHPIFHVFVKKTFNKKRPYTKNLNGDFCAEKESSQNVTKIIIKYISNKKLQHNIKNSNHKWH